MSAQTSSINNMNIITLIKEIFLTLKNLDTRYYTLEEIIKTNMNLMDNKLTILENKILEISQYQLQIIEMNKPNIPIINPNLERELQNHLKDLNIQSKLPLNISEMTIANLLDNNYTVNDINQNFDLQTNKIDNLLF